MDARTARLSYAIGIGLLPLILNVAAVLYVFSGAF
jgi:hypothetical protein